MASASHEHLSLASIPPDLTYQILSHLSLPEFLVLRCCGWPRKPPLQWPWAPGMAGDQLFYRAGLNKGLWDVASGSIEEQPWRRLSAASSWRDLFWQHGRRILFRWHVLAGLAAPPTGRPSRDESACFRVRFCGTASALEPGTGGFGIRWLVRAAESVFPWVYVSDADHCGKTYLAARNVASLAPERGTGGIMRRRPPGTSPDVVAPQLGKHWKLICDVSHGEGGLAEHAASEPGGRFPPDVLVVGFQLGESPWTIDKAVVEVVRRHVQSEGEQAHEEDKLKVKPAKACPPPVLLVGIGSQNRMPVTCAGQGVSYDHAIRLMGRCGARRFMEVSRGSRRDLEALLSEALALAAFPNPEHDLDVLSGPISASGLQRRHLAASVSPGSKPATAAAAAAATAAAAASGGLASVAVTGGGAARPRPSVEQRSAGYHGIAAGGHAASPKRRSTIVQQCALL